MSDAAGGLPSPGALAAAACLAILPKARFHFPGTSSGSSRRWPSRFIGNDGCLASAFRGRYSTANLLREIEADHTVSVIAIRNDESMADPVDSLAHAPSGLSIAGAPVAGVS